MSADKLFTFADLKKSWQKVKAKGGVFSETPFAEKDIDEYLHEIIDQLNSGSYKPDPVRQYVRIRRSSAKEQIISILSIRDRIVQQALVNLLGPLFEPDFLDCSYAYRRGRSALMAADKVEEYIQKGNVWVLETDIASFFQSLDHDILLDCLLKKTADQRVIDLICLYLKAPLFHEMTFSSAEEGISIGGIISPLLSNIYLHPLDLEMIKGSYNYVRYSDDLVVLGLQKEEVRQAFFLIKTTLKKLRLSTKKEKTRICHVSENFDFLGFRFDQTGRGPAIKAIEALQQNIAIISNKKDPTDTKLNDMTLLLQGWRNYYGPLTWLVPQDYITLLALVKIAVSESDLKWAEQLLRIRHKIENDEQALNYYLAKEWLKLGWTEEALFELGQASFSNGNNETIRALVAEIIPLNAEKLSAIIKQLELIAAEPQYAEGYFALSESLVQYGIFKLAQSIHARAAALQDSAAHITSGGELVSANEPVDPEIALSEQDVQCFLDLFTGREDIYAYEKPVKDKERSFTSIKQTLSSEEVMRHLKGDITLATYLIRENHTVCLMAIDIDISKKLLLENKDHPDTINALLELAQTDANRLKSVCDAMGIKTYLEDSGYRGRHCWFFFEEPVPAKKARALAAIIIRKAGEPSGGITWELFPGTDRLKNNQSLHRIKIPLGYHPLSGRRSLFVDETGAAIADQGGYLQLIRRIPLEQVEKVLALAEKRSELQDAPPLKTEEGKQKDSALILEAKGALIKPVVTGCALIRHLIQKAESTNYLPHADRQVLLFVLAHLGEEGAAYLHRVIACCLNYDKKITQKHIDRLPEKPISCGRLRERYPQLSATLKCNCRFNRLPNTYPSPVLHALKKSSATKTKISMPLVENAVPEKIEDEKGDIEAILKRMQNLRRQQQGVEKSLHKCDQLLSAYFDNKQIDRLSVEVGTLVRVCLEDGKVKWIIEI